MTKREKTTTSEAKAPRQVLTKAERVAAYEAAGGRCYVFGAEIPPLGEWTVAVENGRAYLLSPEAKKLKGGRTMEELRAWITEDFAAACEASTRAKAAAEAAKRREQELCTAYRPLFDDTGGGVRRRAPRGGTGGVSRGADWRHSAKPIKYLTRRIECKSTRPVAFPSN